MSSLAKKIFLLSSIWALLILVWQSDFLNEPEDIWGDQNEELTDGRPPLPPPSHPMRPEDRPPPPPNRAPRKPTSMPTVVKPPVVSPKPTVATQRNNLPLVHNSTYRVKKPCGMRSSPSKSSPLVGSVRKNKKLWVEQSKPGWGKVFRKSGPAYIEHDCVL